MACSDDDVVYLGSSSDEEGMPGKALHALQKPSTGATGALGVLMHNAVVKPVLQWMGATKRPRAGDIAPASNASKRRRGRPVDGNSAQPKRSCPWYKKLEGTDFWVDAFHYGNASLCQHYILTHFHSDHYGGLTRRWDSGTIYCNPVTAALVRQQLGVQWKFIHEVPMNTAVQLCGCTVTVLDANHCPGATLWLITTPAGKTHLHVGDFRWHPKMKWLPSLRRFAAGASSTQRLDTLYLDTTYCDAKYTFPPQAAVVRAVVRECCRLAHDPHVLFLFGSYTIGKERLFMAVAEALGERIFVTPPKWRVMQCCGWTPAQMARFTTLETAARIHVVPMGALSADRVEQRWQALVQANSGGGAAMKQGPLQMQPKAPPRKGRGKLARFLHRVSQPNPASCASGGGGASAQGGEEGIAEELGLGAQHEEEGQGGAPKPRLYGQYHSIMAFKPTGWTFTQGGGSRVGGGGMSAGAPEAAQEVDIMGAVGASDTIFSQGTLALLGEQLAAAAAAPGMLQHLSPPKQACVPAGSSAAGRHAMRGVAEMRTSSTVELPTGFAGGAVRTSVCIRGGGAKARHPAWFLGRPGSKLGGARETQSTQLAAADVGLSLTQSAAGETQETQGRGGAEGHGGGATSRRAQHDPSVTARFRGGVTLYGVPYSEHSSFAELRECVAWLGARRVVPTVNAGKAQEMLALLAQA